VTASDQVMIEQEESAVRYTAGTGIQRADVHARARKPNTALHEVAERDDPPPATKVQERAQQAADDLAEKARGWFTSLAAGPSLAHVHPPTMAEAREHVHACANHTSGDLWKVLRISYGYWHLALKFILHVIEWVTRSPWGLLISIFVGFVVWKCI
jgi:hypothetical protein